MLTLNKRFAVLTCVVALVGPPGLGGVACSRPAPSTSIGTKSSAIQGGAADTASTFAVAVTDSSDETCSGTLIAPNLVLTARHCVATDTGGSFVDCTHDAFNAPNTPSKVHVSTGASATFKTSPYVGAKILVPTDNPFCGNDIALIILDKKVPSSEAIPAVPAIDPSATESYGSKVTAIGYGTTEPGGNDDGERRKRANIPVNCIPGDTTLDCSPADYDMTAKEMAIGDGLCEGDSGSGAYVATSLSSGSGPAKVIGVLSRASDDGAKCTDAIYTRTDTFKAFLVDGAKEAAQDGNYSPPTWAGGTGDAGEEPKPTTDDDDASASSSGSSGDEATADASPTAAAPPADDGCSIGSASSKRRSSSPSAAAAAILFVLVAAFSRKKKR